MSERQVLICALPDHAYRYRPDPFPGSTEAAIEGCTCPIAQPWPGKLAFASDCPVHELEVTA